MTDEWVNIFDDMPPIDKRYKRLSIPVIAKLKSGKEVKAFCADDEWHFDSNCKPIKGKVVAWKSIGDD